MKALRVLFATLFLLCLVGTVMSQDVIVKKDQSTVMSKVLEITSTEIKYKKWNNQDGPIYSINRSEVLSINYENGEVEKFSETTNNLQSNKTTQFQYVSSYMTYGGNGRLYLNGRILADVEVQKLVDTQSYQQYLKGRNLAKTGFILDVVGGIALVTAGAMRLFRDNTLSPSVIDTPVLTVLVVGLAIGGTGIIIGMFGSDNAQKVAETYNKKQGNAYSLNISPSLMRYEMPQSQGNCGLGLTLSMNF